MQYHLMEGAGLNGKYQLAQFHFHWGEKGGSEHTVNSHRYPSEIHLVHHKEKFADLGAALKSGEIDALAVIGVFIETSDSVPLKGFWKNMWTAMKASTSAGSNATVDMEKATIRNLLPDSGDYEHYWRYEGSLTTPPCNEQVVWTVMRDTLKVPTQLVEDMALVEDSKGQAHNMTYRHEMNLHERALWFNEPGHTHAIASGSVPLYGSLLWFVIAFIASAITSF